MVLSVQSLRITCTDLQKVQR